MAILNHYEKVFVFSCVTQALFWRVKNLNLKQFAFAFMTTIGLFEADLEATSVSPETMRKHYYTSTYPSDHWALQPYVLEDSKVIAIAYYKGSEYAIYTNPTDKRGYRCIVRLISNEDMGSTINREYSSQEQRGLSLVVELVEKVFRNIVPIVQTFKAGNNSHKFDLETRIIYIGKAEEPSFLHTHIIGRGDPEAEYIADIKLDGPIPGLNFDMMGKTLNELGNDKKVKWKEEDMAKVVHFLKAEMDKVKKEYEAEGLIVISENRNLSS